VPDNYNSVRDGRDYRDRWLVDNHRAFLRMWQDRKDEAAIAAGAPSPPAKRPRAGLSALQSAFLQSSIEIAVQQVEQDLKEDEYEVWKWHTILPSICFRVRESRSARLDKSKLHPIL
jgi:hypothetical protein